MEINDPTESAALVLGEGFLDFTARPATMRGSVGVEEAVAKDTTRRRPAGFATGDAVRGH